MNENNEKYYPLPLKQLTIDSPYTELSFQNYANYGDAIRASILQFEMAGRHPLQVIKGWQDLKSE